MMAASAISLSALDEEQHPLFCHSYSFSRSGCDGALAKKEDKRNEAKAPNYHPGKVVILV